VAFIGCAHAEILHVGDHPETDIDGARQAGLYTAWMNRIDAEWPEHLAPPDTVVKTLAELVHQLKAARSRHPVGL
jgi:putative hydrolase of the HAD superfamily